jgi:DHA1 family tetracycline resistance protein-like MFS transporter
LKTEIASQTTDRRLIAIFLIVFIDVLGLTIILPLLPFYAEHFGAKPLMVGALVSVYSICQFISGPILGHWSDRIGRKPILVVSQIGTCIGFLVLASAHSLAIIFLSRIIDGLTAGNLSTAQAYISDVAAPQDRAKQLGRIGIAFAVGFFVGPALTAFLYGFGYQAPILAAASLSALSVLASTVLLPRETRPIHASPAAGTAKTSLLSVALSYFKNPNLARLFAEIFLFYFSFSIYVAGFALFAERRFSVHGVALNAKQVGYAFAYFGFLGIVVQGFLIGKVVKRFGERQVVRLGFVSSFLGYSLLAVIVQPVWLACSGLFTSFGGGVLRPVLLSEITGEVNPKERGRAIGVTQSIQSVAQIVGPLLGTALIGSAHLVVWALLPALLNALGFFLVAQRIKRAGAIPLGSV